MRCHRPLPARIPKHGAQTFPPERAGSRRHGTVYRQCLTEKLQRQAHPSRRRATNYKYSIQILFRSHEGMLSWSMFQGSYGIPVDPCASSGPLKRLVSRIPETRKDLSFLAPPYVGDGTKWYVQMDGFGNCWYEAAPNDPGHVACKEFLEFPLTKDAQYGGGSVTCLDTEKGRVDSYHRAWVLEY
jgi:hypothetical protein